MSEVTVFCVQPYARREGEIVKGDLRQFRSETTATNAAKVASHQATGVIVYSLRGHPEFDAWGEPVVVATFGELPASQFG